MEGGGKNVAYIAAAAILGYLFNYNTVEMILLFCCCLIALSGIMFESGRLQTSSFSSQSNAIAAFVILIIILSILYCTHLLSSLLPLPNCPMRSAVHCCPVCICNVFLLRYF